MGAREEPGWRLAMEGERSGSDDPRRFRSVEEARSDHADHGSLAEARPGLRENLATLLRAPGRIRRCIRARMVQADASRHGSDPALSWPARAEGDADLARSDPCAR